MKTITFTEFRRQASGLLTEVENGESYVIIRHGKPIAELAPYAGAADRDPAWKRPGVLLNDHGQSLSTMILEERDTYE